MLMCHTDMVTSTVSGTKLESLQSTCTNNNTFSPLGISGWLIYSSVSNSGPLFCHGQLSCSEQLLRSFSCCDLELDPDKLLSKCNNNNNNNNNNNTHLTALCPELPEWADTRKVKPIWIYCCKRQWVAVASTWPYANLHLAPDSTPPLSFFYKPDALPAANQQRKSTEGSYCLNAHTDKHTAKWFLYLDHWSGQWIGWQQTTQISVKNDASFWHQIFGQQHIPR